MPVNKKNLTQVICEFNFDKRNFREQNILTGVVPVGLRIGKNWIMKKLALICGLLFVVVFVLVNLTESDDDSLENYYHVSAASARNQDIDADAYVYPASLEGDVTDISGSAYYLIIASYNDIIQAQEAADKYKSDYDADFIILPPTPEGNYRISFGRYSTSGSAAAELPTVRQTINPDAWVYSAGN